jgi:hypothetical protein
MSDLILMPKTLTAENGAKGLLIGEFSENIIMQCEYCEGGYNEDDDETCRECDGAGDFAVKVPVSWDTIKEIYAMYSEYHQNKLEQKEK